MAVTRRPSTESSLSRCMGKQPPQPAPWVVQPDSMLGPGGSAGEQPRCRRQAGRSSLPGTSHAPPPPLPKRRLHYSTIGQGLRMPSCLSLPPCRPAAPPPCHPAALPPCRPAALPPCRPAALPPCRPAALPPCRPAALPPCRPAALPPCRPAALPPCRPAALPPCRPAALPPCRPAALPPCRPAALPPHPG
jgi:hypothetical protein